MNTINKKATARRTPIIIIIIIALICSFLALFQSMTDRTVNKVSDSIGLQYSRDLNAQMTAHIYNALDDYSRELDMLHGMLSSVDGLNEQKLQSFAERSERNEDLDFLAFADDSGYVYSAKGSYLGTMRISMLGRLLNGAELVVSDNETVNGESYIMLGRSYSTPVVMGDAKICIAIMGISNTSLSDSLMLTSNYSGAYCSIIKTDGSFVIKNPSVRHGGLNIYEILENSGAFDAEEVASLKKSISLGQAYMLKIPGDDGGTGTYLYFAPIENSGWYAVNALPSNIIRNSIEGMQTRLTHISALVIALIAGLAAAVIILQSRGVKKLAESREQLADALKLAKEASDSKTTFLFNMSHDIRTPMNAILGYTRIGLRHAGDTDRSQDCFRKIMTSGGHLLSLINDVLEMSRVEAGKLEIEEQPLDVRRAAADVDLMSRALASEKSIDFQTLIGDIKNPYIYADELHVNEILINLVSNAVKYTPEDGKVTYSISQISDVIDGKVTFRFEVADNGIGMSEDFQRHLFEAFSREKNTTMSKVEGTGLGLSIVKRILDLLGGDIRVKSRQGEGSLFSVEIPFTVMEDDAITAYIAENAQQDAILDNAALEGSRVLLVEDNEMNREIALDILTEAGLETESAENGELAVKAVLDKGMSYYDFILMDIQMPVMNGYEATRAIRALPGGDRVPIIALSANAFEQDIKLSLENGMNSHIAKPIDIKALFAAMRSFKR